MTVPDTAHIDVIDRWVDADPDPDTRAELRALSPDDLRERFDEPLRFGTAGLRGPVRGGPSGMNVAVVTTATAALTRWLHESGHSGGTVVVGRDARHGSVEFATAAAEVAAAAGFEVVALPGATPTPLVAFAARDLRAVAAIQVTASHNPAADNGYKVYLEQGAQLIPPADSRIEELMSEVGRADEVPRTPVSDDPRADQVRDRYLRRLLDRFGSRSSTLRIALTPMHGVGGTIAVEALRQAGFDDLHVVAEQFAPDPDFPTVAFPNPEEPGAADRLLALARDVDADIAIALDPDADRCAVGAAVDGRWRMLTGDETGGLLGAFLLDEAAPFGDSVPVVANTIVSGTLLPAVAAAAGARHVQTLTGFKWLVRAGEPLLYVYEEAIGHCVDPDAVRDKDGLSAAVCLAVLAHQATTLGAPGAGTGLIGVLHELFREHGAHLSTQRAIRVDHLDQITAMMSSLRARPPRSVAGVALRLDDFAERTDHLRTDAVALTGEDEASRRLRVVVRPSGTEPKLKSYLQIVGPVDDADSLTDVIARCGALLEAVGDDVESMLREAGGASR
ncbi:phospho-sugar mutase [Williamsia sterculiae]|uniref:Phosphomannomutase n=1 Tax=Williamsia sterculiae TaxID=1344003 RepID=A0A1N7DXJ9_9NOCA|nr:phospho-sugar mutase [Williamsia sterculiae]SIR80577.1 phosphomannomutase [Williamsia sterculiae]